MTAAGIDPQPDVGRGPVAAVGGAIAGLVGLVGAFIVSLFRDLLAEEFQGGRIRTKGLPAGVRVAVLAAVALAVALFVSIGAADAWRTLDPHVITGGQTLRGTLVPELLVPVTFAILAFAAALCVSGALRAGPWVGVLVGAAYGVIATFVHGYTVGDDGLHRVAGWSIIAVLVLLVVVRHLPPHPVVELLACLGLVGFTFADAHRLLVATDRASGADFLAGQTEVLLSDVLFLSAPLLLVAALSVINFGVTTARWSVGFTERHLSRRVVVGAAVVLGLWRLSSLGRTVRTAVVDEGAWVEMRALTGSVAMVALLVGVAALVRRSSGSTLAEEDPRTTAAGSMRVALPLALGLTAVTALVAVLYLVVQGVSSVLPFEASQHLSRWILDVIPRAGRFGASGTWTFLRAVGALALCVLLARRDRPATATFVGAVGAILLDQWATAPGRLGEAWAWRVSGVGVIAVGALLVSLARWWRQGALSERRAAWALYLLLLTGLLDRGSALSDPIAPFLAFSGVAFVLFGLIWNFATEQGWANETSRTLPRISRAQLMLGYQVLAVAILHWYVISHDLSPLENLTKLQPDTGTSLLGQPLVLVLILAAFASALADVDLATTDDPPEEGAEEDPDEEGAAEPSADPALGTPLGDLT